MKEKELNTLIENYINSLKKSSLGASKRIPSIEKFSMINRYLLENGLYEFEVELLSSESLNLIKERSINIKLKKKYFKHSPKSKIYDFVQKHSAEEIHNHIASKAEKGNLDLKTIINLTEIELQKLLDISKEDFKKYTPKNIAFVKLKKQIFLKLIEHSKLEKASIAILLKDSNPNYKNIENGFILIEKELYECDISAYYFLTSIIEEKPIRRKLRMII